VGADDGTIRVVDLADGSPVEEPWRAGPGPVTALAVGRLQGTVLAFTSAGEPWVKAWELSGRSAAAPLPTPAAVDSAAYDPESGCLVIGGLGGAAVICPCPDR
jgi:hypothetical protein